MTTHQDTSTEREALKPCPFCGNEARLVDDLVTFHVECGSCGATGSVSSYSSGALDCWNRRAALASRDEAAQQPQGQELELREMEARKDAAYLERNQVVAALAKCFPSGIARTAIDGWSEDWHGCVYIDLPTGQASWHFHDSHADLFADLPPYQGKWDGHTTEEKYARLAALKSQGQAVSDEQLREIDDAHDWQTTNGRMAAYRAILALRDKPEQRVPLSDDFATIAGLESAVGHLSTLVDEQRALLVESEDVFGRDGHGGRYEDGECGLIDRIRAHLEMTAPPPNGTTAKEQGNGN